MLRARLRRPGSGNLSLLWGVPRAVLGNRRNEVPSGWKMRADPRIAVMLLPGVSREADEQDVARNVPE